MFHVDTTNVYHLKAQKTPSAECHMPYNAASSVFFDDSTAIPVRKNAMLPVFPFISSCQLGDILI